MWEDPQLSIALSSGHLAADSAMSLGEVCQSSVTESIIGSRPRAIFYGVGYYASEAVRILVARRWSIDGALNRAGPKLGQDLGRMAGLNSDL